MSVCVHVSVCVHTCMCVFTCTHGYHSKSAGSEEMLQELVLHFHHIGSRDQTQEQAALPAKYSVFSPTPKTFLMEPI